MGCEKFGKVYTRNCLQKKSSLPPTDELLIYLEDPLVQNPELMTSLSHCSEKVRKDPATGGSASLEGNSFKGNVIHVAVI